MSEKTPPNRSERRRKGIPLALVIVRYFVYVLVSTVVLLGALIMTFGILSNTGVIYIANYAEQNMPQLKAALESGEIDTSEIPASYYWAVYDESGTVVSTDMPPEEADAVWESVLVSSNTVQYTGLYGVQKQETVMLPNGDLCVLSYDYVPDFTSRELRDTLPDPQAILTAVFFVLFIGMLAVIAIRASRVISRKMQPLSDAAANIEKQNLDFEIGSTNVREVNEVLAAMERMRSSLDESLKAQWAADEAQRRQIAALAHDLRTPLAVARWNTDLLQETDLDTDQAASAQDISESIARMDNYMKVLTEVSQRDAAPPSRTEVDVPTLVEEIRQQAQQLCKQYGLSLNLNSTSESAIWGDTAEITRAVTNLVSNAVEHAPKGSCVTVRFFEEGDSLVITVEDEGPGFSDATLEHGKDRFFTGTEDRNSSGSHYGLGLSIVDDIISAHEGSLTLVNAENGGALCTLKVPLR